MEFSHLAKQVFDAIVENGGYVYIVGGSVRDEILNISNNHDIDVEVYQLTYQQLYDALSTFGHVNTFGKSFAIMQLENLKGYDFALPRMEKKIGERHQDFDVMIDPYLPIEKAVQRRDITMNALMYDYVKDTIIDCVHGQEDIQNKIIRCVNPKTFIEDPLRVLRVAQFMSRFEMDIDEKTKELCQQMVQNHMLDYLPIERIYEEYCKILMSRRPSLGFQFLCDIQALPPYLQKLSTTQQRLDYHPEGDVFKHTMLVVDIAALSRYKVDEPLSFMWACLLHDIGKPIVTTPEGKAPRHAEVGAEVFEKEVHLITSKKQRLYVKTMIRYHMSLMNMMKHQQKDIQYLRILKQIDEKISLNDLITISCCDKLGRGGFAYETYNRFLDYMNEKIQRLGYQAPSPLINGNDLLDYGFKNKQKFKDILNEAYDLQLQGIDKEEILRSLMEKYE